MTRDDFASMFQASWRRLWCIAIAVVHDRGAAEDVLQEAALVAMGKLDQFKEGTSFTAWMGQIVRYVALNQARSRQRRRTASDDGLGGRGMTPPAPPSPLTSDGSLRPEQASFDDSLVRALRGLDPTASACLLLRSVEGLSYREIARSLEIPEGTAMSHVHRSRAALRESLRGATAPRREGS